jgi:hypothetical protein
MYSKQEASILRQSFWTAFGKYMLPVPNAEGEKINWINYKTGIKHIFFRMDAGKSKASIAIQITGGDAAHRQLIYEQFLSLEKMLHRSLGEEWSWRENILDEHGKPVHSIGKEIRGVNVFSQESWPEIISFLKPRIIALDEFWMMVKEGFG